MKFSFFILLIFILTGCQTAQPVIQNRTTTVTEVQHDTTVVIRPDTASVKALFECDSLNQVVLKELEISKGRKITPVVKYLDRVLEITMPVDSEAVYIAWKERHEQEVKTVVVPNTEVKKPPWYLRGLSWIGAFALFGLIIFFLLKLRIR